MWKKLYNLLTHALLKLTTPLRIFVMGLAPYLGNDTDVCCRALPASGSIQKLEALSRRPIMFYRPEQPDGSDFLKASHLMRFWQKFCLKIQQYSGAWIFLFKVAKV